MFSNHTMRLDACATSQVKHAPHFAVARIVLAPMAIERREQSGVKGSEGYMHYRRIYRKAKNSPWIVESQCRQQYGQILSPLSCLKLFLLLLNLNRMPLYYDFTMTQYTTPLLHFAYFSYQTMSLLEKRTMHNFTLNYNMQPPQDSA